jgi:hypothetical protein
MAPWLMFILFVVVCLTVLMYLQKPKQEYVTEHFQDTAWKGRHTEFMDGQYNLFHNQLNNGILMNPGLNFAPGEYDPAQKQMQGVGTSTVPDKVYKHQLLGVGLLNDAVRSPDVYLANSPEKDFGVYMVPDPVGLYTDLDNKFCASARHPRDLPKRDAKLRTGCGWYFVPDLDRQSVGAIGSRAGPMLADKMPPNGEWIWDIPTAIMKEDIKHCSRVKTCDVMDVNGIHGICGWCPSKDVAVPINAAGQAKYPGFEGGACSGPIKRSSNDCRPATNTSDPANSECKNLGSPDFAKNKRIYNKQECDALGGTLYENGICLGPNGNPDFSEKCKKLNIIATGASLTSTNVQQETCSPVNGLLSRECLISLATSLGFTKQGSIVRMLYTTDRPSDEDNFAIEALKSAGLSVPNAVLGAGDISKDSAGNIYKSIFDATTSGRSRIVKNAAKLLATGAEEFDMCDFDEKDVGPFPTVCLQQAWRRAGCQPAGSEYPKSGTASSNLEWGAIRKTYGAAYNAMKSTDALKQAKATESCLGIQFGTSKPFECTEQGVETLFYSWAPQDIYVWGSERYAAYIGRETTTNGFKSYLGVNSLGGDTGTAFDTNKKTMKMRTRIVPVDDVNGAAEVFTDDGTLIVNNGKTVLNAWKDQATTRYVANVPMRAGSKNNMEIYYYNNGGYLNFDVRGSLATLAASSFLQFPSKAPVVAFDFFRGRLDDIHGSVKSKVFGNVGFNKKGGIQGAKFGFNQYIQIMTPLRFKAFRSYTCMINMDEFNSTWYPSPAIFDFSTTGDLNSPGQGGAVNPSMGLYYPNKNAYENRVVAYTYRRNYWYGNAAKTPVPSNNTWVHIAVVWRNDWYGHDLYINGKKMASGFMPDLYHDVGRAKGGSGDKRYPDSIFKVNYIGGFSPVTGMGPIGTPDAWRAYQYNSKAALNGTMAWLHFYDYPLTPAEIVAEMNYHNVAQPVAPAFKKDLMNEGVQI